MACATYFDMESQNTALDPLQQTHLLQEFSRFNRLSEQLNASFVEISSSFNRFQPSHQSVPPPGQSELVDAIPGGVIILDPHGLVREMNTCARELLGDSASGQPWRDVVGRTFLPNLDQGELKTLDGRHFSISTKPLGYAPGQVLLLSEVTGARELQRAAQQNLHLVTMGKMMASLAHQIRTPLTSAMLYLSQCASKGMDQKTVKDFCQKALARNRHIEKLINDMLMFAHGGQFVTTRFSVGELLSDLEDQLQPHIQQRGAELQLTVRDKAAELQGNKDVLLGALANLCMNALQACEQRPRIEIVASLSLYGLLSIMIKDNGSGMERDVCQRIFDPFFSTKTDGTGLGLAVVKSVVESHQGRVAVFSRPGKGCRFRLFLPCRQATKTQISESFVNQTSLSNQSGV